MSKSVTIANHFDT